MAPAPTVLLHGLTFDRTTWRPVVDRLAGEFRCVAIDLPGHGGTPGPPRPMAEIAEDVHRLLTTLEIERPVLVGHSMGAVLAVVYAAAFPVRGVVTVDQSLDLKPLADLLRRLEPSLRGDGFTSAFEPFRRDIGVHNLPEPERGRVAASQRVHQEVVLGYFDELLQQAPERSETSLGSLLETIDAPLLAVFGRGPAVGGEKRPAPAGAGR